VRGEKVWQAHREHFYQRLVRAGYSHVQVTLSESAIQVVVAVAIWWGTTQNVGIRVAIGSGVILVWLAFFAFAEREFRRALAGPRAVATAAGR
jgi:hypothetical protein